MDLVPPAEPVPEIVPEPIEVDMVPELETPEEVITVINSTTRSLCRKLLKRLREHPESYPFLNPVDLTVPFYHSIIEEPIDLGTIEERLKSAISPYERIEDVGTDILRIFTNCFLFNADIAFVFQEGVKLKKIVAREWKKVFPSIPLTEPAARLSFMDSQSFADFWVQFSKRHHLGKFHPEWLDISWVLENVVKGEASSGSQTLL